MDEPSLGFLREQNIGASIIDELQAFRRAHPVPEQFAYRVPQPRVHYLGRQVWEQASAALLAGENVLLSGPKATGKNVLAQDLAYVFGRPEWDVSFHIDMDASYLIGTDTYSDGEVTFRPGPICACATAGGFGVLDEINMARSEALAVLHATLDFRRIIDVGGYDLITLDEATRFIGTMNIGYVGTRELNDALVSRFAIISLPPLSADDLQRLLQREFPTLKPKAAEQVALLFGEIRKKCEEGQISDKPLDLRGLMNAVKLVEHGLDLCEALQVCLVNKTFDSYERELVQDCIDARVPRSLHAGDVFD